MCQYGVISVTSAWCEQANTLPEAHTWQKYTYTLCTQGLRNGIRCENSEKVEFATGPASTRLASCRICDKIPAAEAAKAQSTAQALELYNAEVTAAQAVFDAAVERATSAYNATVAEAAATYTQEEEAAWSEIGYVRPH
jgi:hypothetical protein